MATKYQKSIFAEIKQGAKLKCTEGSHYKIWLVYENGDKKTIRRDTAEILCSEFEEHLIFGEKQGIRIKKLNKQ